MLIKEHLAALLREEILTGRLAAGEPIVECKWAARLGVAQASIREAINILMTEGYVQKDAGRTARVTLLRADDIQQIYELRQPLEALAARLTAARRADLSEVEQNVRDMQAAIDCGNARAAHERDLRFHLLISELSGNRYLVQHVRRLIVPLFAYCVIQALNNGHAKNGLSDLMQEHWSILDALRTGDPDLAEQVVSRTFGSFLNGTRDLTATT